MRLRYYALVVSHLEDSSPADPVAFAALSPRLEVVTSALFVRSLLDIKFSFARRTVPAANDPRELIPVATITVLVFVQPRLER